MNQETNRSQELTKTSTRSDAMLATLAGLLSPGRGILAADESLPNLNRQFAALDMPSTPESRRDYREMLFSIPELDRRISGIILFEETLNQQTCDGTPMGRFLEQRGLIPGIKVDHGIVDLPGFPGEKITEGLDGLRERLSGYRESGARFTKWRAVISADDGHPSHACLEANVGALALFAALSHEAGLVPILEPEVLMDGGHTLARCEEVTTHVLDRLFSALSRRDVTLEWLLLKASMVLAGRSCPEQAGLEQVAEATLRCLRRAVPAAVPGIVFLSGGQGDVAATQRLAAICAGGSVPWTLTFSFGRALQSSAMSAWKGLPENRHSAQQALFRRAQFNGLAVEGRYSPTSEAAVF